MDIAFWRPYGATRKRSYIGSLSSVKKIRRKENIQLIPIDTTILELLKDKFLEGSDRRGLSTLKTFIDSLHRDGFGSGISSSTTTEMLNEILNELYKLLDFKRSDELISWSKLTSYIEEITNLELPIAMSAAHETQERTDYFRLLFDRGVIAMQEMTEFENSIKEYLAPVLEGVGYSSSIMSKSYHDMNKAFSRLMPSSKTLNPDVEAEVDAKMAQPFLIPDIYATAAAAEEEALGEEDEFESEGGEGDEETIAALIDARFLDLDPGEVSNFRKCCAMSDPSRVLIERFNIPLSVHSLSKLAPGDWLNDEV